MDTTADTIIWKRNKLIAILIAVFFGPWSWLYTYSRDPGKAAAGIGSNLSIILPLAIMDIGISKIEEAHNAGEPLVYCFIVALPIFIATWIASIACNSIEKKWYLSEPKGRSKIAGIIIAIFLGPWTWFYTYPKDYWKFWLSIIICYGVFGIGINGIIDPLPVPIVITITWIASIVNASIRSNTWYKSFGKD
jgi:hypothetical protein